MNSVLILLLTLGTVSALPERMLNFNTVSQISSLYQSPFATPATTDNSVNPDDSETPIVSKNYHTAPEEPAEEPRTILTAKAQKSYKILFIRAPVYKPAKLSLVNPAQSEDRTIIYVLSKKIDSTDLDIATPAPITEPIRPEVFFIKYKTQEEAWNAQQQIQAHYDALGGETYHNGEEVAPIQAAYDAHTLPSSALSANKDVSSPSSLSSFSTSSTANDVQRNANEYIPPLLDQSANSNHLLVSPYLPPVQKYFN